MTIDIVTIFPRMVESALTEGVVARAREAGLVEIGVVDLRDFADDRHRTVDDEPFGGGAGMVMRPDVIARALDRVSAVGSPRPAIYLTPRGRPVRLSAGHFQWSARRLELQRRARR